MSVSKEGSQKNTSTYQILFKVSVNKKILEVVQIYSFNKFSEFRQSIYVVFVGCCFLFVDVVFDLFCFLEKKYSSLFY